MPDLATDPLTEEVRVAMALNGGVSLAVWMGGCAVELDAARRAHLPADQDTVYTALVNAFKRVLVVDVLSGASAGGINGALIAAAVVNRRSLTADFVRDRWLALGDFAKLLHRTSNADPRSLMQGEMFVKHLETTFKQLIFEQPKDGSPPDTPPLDVKLDITTTDVAGKRMRFVDYWGQGLEAREYRARFRFRAPEQYGPERLAHAARASASFPLAFEPFKVSAEDARLAGLEGTRWLIDGGLLDNAPISAAIDLIPGRRATRQVRRFVCYVNAEPPVPIEPQPGEPTMLAIAGHIISLPRKAPFVDQLRAVDAATRRGLAADRDPQFRLLGVKLETLQTTATALFDAYRIERTLSSLEELLGSPGAATEIVRGNPDLQLPWIPTSLAPLDCEDRWQWGLLTALRAMHLMLDAIRRGASAEDANDEKRVRLYAAFAQVDEQRARLDKKHATVLDSAAGSENALAVAIAEVDVVKPFDLLNAAFKTLETIKEDLLPDDRTALFGEIDGAFRSFLDRALALEVVLRAYHSGPEIQSGQELRFVQLTPEAPGLLFRRLPWVSRGWDTPAEKLLGLRLGHFAGFYRESWRENDFMWGRMDAAARIVDMLVAPGRVKQIRGEAWAGDPAWTVLAHALSDGATPTQAMLLEEALEGMPDGYPRDDGELSARLEAALKYDLAGETLDRALRGRLTRIVCTRAAQLAVFEQELPHLVATSTRDHKLGAATKALAFDDVGDALAELRDKESLQTRLAAPDELTSTLALRTSAHAGLVALGALRAARVPLGRSLLGARSLLLPIAGSVANTRRSRFGVLLAFTAAAMLLASRIVTTHKQDEVGINGSWASYLVLAVLALGVVVGASFVPALRLIRGVLPGPRAVEGVTALALLLTGVAGAGAVALVWGDRTLTQLIAGPGAGPPPDWLMGVVIALVVGLPLALVPAVLRGWLDAFVRQPWGGFPMLVLFAIASGLVIAAAAGPLLSAVTDGPGWARAAALFAFPGAPLVACVSLRLWRPGLRELVEV